MDKLNLKAFAKINLGLEVLFKRADGFHEINTVFARTGLADDIVIQEHSELAVECEPGLDIPMQNNLAFIAAEKLIEKFKPLNQNAKITIKKNIPSGGGLGGGSSDAAAVLLGLNDFWEIRANYDNLHSIAAAIGSDVPYFLKEGSATASGRGEILNYFDYIIPYYILLVFPGTHVDTGKAYKMLNRSPAPANGSDFKSVILGSNDNPETLRNEIYNDFEDYVFKEFPHIKKIKENLYKLGSIFALMSGSGSTVFGFFEDLSSAERAAGEITYDTFICKL